MIPRSNCGQFVSKKDKLLIHFGTVILENVFVTRLEIICGLNCPYFQAHDTAEHFVNIHWTFTKLLFKSDLCLYG